MSWVDPFNRLEPAAPFEKYSDFHGTITIPLCELIDCGFLDFNDASWDFVKYNEEQHKRLCEKITKRFYFREINILPPGAWKIAFLEKMNEIMPKYITLYKQIEKGFDPLQTSSEYGKSRDIFSDFPQTELSGNSDYASSGSDREFETIRQGNLSAQIAEFAEKYQDADVLILNEIEPLFSSLLTLNVNGF